MQKLNGVICLGLLLSSSIGIAADEPINPATPLPGQEQLVLPPLPEQFETDERLSALPRIQINQFRFEGNTVFSDAELGELVSDYQGRPVTAAELRDVPARITRHYVENGYVTSGALLPDQTVQDGNVTILIVEGSITEIELEGQQHLRPGYLTGRLETASPLQVNELEQKIQLLQRNPMVQRINAQVAPAPVQGENVLRVRVKEESPYAAGVVYDNGRPPSIGSDELEFWVMDKSLFGWGDRLEAHYSINDGPNGYWLGYSLPLNARDTTLSVAYERNDSLVIEEPFDDIDIESRFNRAEISLRHPFIKTLEQELALSVGLEWRHAETYLLNEDYSFAPGVDNGETKVTLVHFVQEWLDRGQDRLVALRSDIRWGVDLFDATVNSHLPDGEYVGWEGQFQWVERLPVLDSRLVVRGIAQLASNGLLPSEKFSIGGMDTVRGYRENYLTTDEGMVAGIEWQVPVGHLKIPGVSTGFNDGLLELAAFYDYGQGSNKSFQDPDPDNISSVGLGVLWHPTERIAAKVYWGYALRNVDDYGEHDLQDDGISFAIGAEFF